MSKLLGNLHRAAPIIRLAYISIATRKRDSVPGLYMFASQNSDGSWRVYYVGQTDSFKDRIPHHDQWAPAVRKGATVNLACPASDQNTRSSIKRALCQTVQPVLNQHLRGSPGLPARDGLRKHGYGIGLLSDHR